MAAANHFFSAGSKSTRLLHEAMSWARVAGYCWCSRRCCSTFFMSTARLALADTGLSARATAPVPRTRESESAAVLMMVRMVFPFRCGSAGCAGLENQTAAGPCEPPLAPAFEMWDLGRGVHARVAGWRQTA